MPNNIYQYQPIDPIECMGDSLAKINNNNFLADGAIGILETRIVAASASLNTRIASTSSTIITTLSTVPYARLNDGNQSGIAPIYGCRAWVNFDGSRNEFGVADLTNTNRYIRAAGNVSSVLRNGQGDYTVTFTIPMPDANYCLTGVSRPENNKNNLSVFAPLVSNNGSVFLHAAPTASTARVVAGASASSGTWDSDYVMVTVFR